MRLVMLALSLGLLVGCGGLAPHPSDADRSAAVRQSAQQHGWPVADSVPGTQPGVLIFRLPFDQPYPPCAAIFTLLSGGGVTVELTSYGATIGEQLRDGRATPTRANPILAAHGCPLVPLK